ncbi:sulfatase-like hydrolase/transferase [uncultured Bacteroides sp.]|uniref:LTA synthase family protein n=1 Tax=uncultured Bacteroides sp. TaxID=162156 RepID=UPI00280C192A|nr:sulfatase-like hydrolase/transferase [uncultured Bacteroides sp.]
MKRFSIKRFGYYLLYLLSIHVVALLFFFVFRLTLFCSIDYQFPADIEGDLALKSVAFVRGLWFDNVIACYILLLPLVAVWITALFNYTAKWLFRSVAVYFILFYSLSFIIAAANIPYFEYFFKTINSSIYNWFGYGGTTAGMVFGESSYYFPIFLGILSIVLFGWGVFFLASYFYRRSETTISRISWKSRLAILPLGTVCVGLCLFGIRGRTGYNPIKVSQAYYCDDPFLNQLGVNPVFNLLTSTLDDNRKENRTLHLMSEQEALKQVQNYLQRKGVADISPIARKVEREGVPNRKNVVLIFMESMSANLMGSFGSDKKLTPYLDSLYRQSLSFERFYSSGIHTNHGIYSTLFSFPAIMKRNAMKGSVIPVYSGLPTVLKDNGYCNLFFMTHESQYDNMNAFLRTNGFDEIYAQENYPSEKVVNSFGVQDDFMYQYALPILNEKADTGEPFFTVLLSISNHPPYVIPPYFHPHSEKLEEQIVEYADWSIRQFMDAAEKQPWFDNTIFVFLGDHGKMVGTPECEMPQSYNHIPLMIYGKDIPPTVHNGFGGQIDVAPTLLGMLNMSYLQNNFGVNLLEEERPCMFFTADNLIGARDLTHLFIYSPDNQQEFKYKLENEKLHVAADDEGFGLLKNYCFSMLQCTEQMVKEHKTIDRAAVK